MFAVVNEATREVESATTPSVVKDTSCLLGITAT